MKHCNFCGGEIQDKAIKCKHCGAWLDKTPQSLNRPHYQDNNTTADLTKKYKDNKGLRIFFYIALLIGIVLIILTHYGK